MTISPKLPQKISSTSPTHHHRPHSPIRPRTPSALGRSSSSSGPAHSTPKSTASELLVAAASPAHSLKSIASPTSSTGRPRGRPRKYPRPTGGSPQKPPVHAVGHSNKPREEQAYTDYYPDLDSHTDLTVNWNNNSKVSAKNSAVQTYLHKRLASLVASGDVSAMRIGDISSLSSHSGKEDSYHRLSNGGGSGSLFTSLSQIVHGVVDQFQKRFADANDYMSECSSGRSSPSRNKRSESKEKPVDIDTGSKKGSCQDVFTRSLPSAANRPHSGPVLKVKSDLSKLPKSSFKMIPEKHRIPGPSDNEPFSRSLAYIRYNGPDEFELDHRVEYDMDEQGAYAKAVM